MELLFLFCLKRWINWNTCNKYRWNFAVSFACFFVCLLNPRCGFCFSFLKKLINCFHFVIWFLWLCTASLSICRKTSVYPANELTTLWTIYNIKVSSAEIIQILIDRSVNWLIASWEFSQLSQLNSCTFVYWVTVSRADHSAVHHSVCVMPATGSTCQWASHCPVAQRDNDFATIWLPLPPVCQPFAILYSHLSLSLSFMPSLALPHSFSSSFRRRRCCRRCRSQNVRKNRNENFWLPVSEEGKSKANKANKTNKTNTRSHLGD